MKTDSKLDALLKMDVAPLLKRAGFTRSRRHFFRWQGEVCSILNFFRSKYSSPVLEMFTIEATVTLRYLHEPSNGHGPPKSLLDAVPVIFQRFGPAADPLGQFWQVTSDTDLLAIACDVESHLIGQVLPFFERFKTDELILGHLESNPEKPSRVVNHARRAIILDRLGNPGRSRDSLQYALSEYEQTKDGLREVDRQVLDSFLRRVETYLQSEDRGHRV
jgi:Domain of unknown function (DUF4304)